jgi:hypothetical protein
MEFQTYLKKLGEFSRLSLQKKNPFPQEVDQTSCAKIFSGQFLLCFKNVVVDGCCCSD